MKRLLLLGVENENFRRTGFVMYASVKKIKPDVYTSIQIMNKCFCCNKTSIYKVKTCFFNDMVLVDDKGVELSFLFNDNEVNQPLRWWIIDLPVNPWL